MKNSLGKSSDLLNWANLNFIATADLILLEILPTIDQRQAEPVPRTNFISAMEYGGYCYSGMATMTHNYYPSIFYVGEDNPRTCMCMFIDAKQQGFHIGVLLWHAKFLGLSLTCIVWRGALHLSIK